MAEACVFLMESDAPAELLNVGTGVDVTIAEVAALVREGVGNEGEIVFDRSKPDGTPRKLLDVGRLAALGWRSRIGLRDGLAQTYEWFVDHASGAARATAGVS